MGDDTVVTPSALRPWALRAMIAGLAALMFTLALRTADDAEPATASTPDAAVDATSVATPPPRSTPTPNPFAVTSPDESLTIVRLWSPGPNQARIEGTATTSELTVAVQIDGRPQSPITIRSGADGFVVDLANLEPGPQEVCLNDACQRVLVAAPDTASGGESVAETAARIAEAIELVEEEFDLDVLLPGWSLRMGGANTSQGGRTSDADRAITINANPGRTVADYRITVLHELAHGLDAEWLSESERQAFRALRGHDANLGWGPVPVDATALERWRNGAEDFAEVFVAWAEGGDYDIASTVVAPQPSDADLAEFCQVVLAPTPIDC